MNVDNQTKTFNLQPTTSQRGTEGDSRQTHALPLPIYIPKNHTAIYECLTDLFLRPIAFQKKYSLV
jgi:hypothetical protein